ncbi:hypothetical protein ACL9RL_10060 [Plantibacter sp. Mn2098]|uniref:hypothetical protein n=1 Tax=Plantibacter sp. Mn2098 TaxID=3395266 RepID=UPI003BEBA292
MTATGHSFDWTNNNPRTCNGWLQIRINGQQVGNINMSVIPSSTPTVLCVVGAGHATFSLYFVSTPAGWVLALSALLLARLGCA